MRGELFLLLSFEIKGTLPKACSKHFPLCFQERKSQLEADWQTHLGIFLACRGVNWSPHWFGWQNCHCPEAWVGEGSSYFEEWNQGVTISFWSSSLVSVIAIVGVSIDFPLTVNSHHPKTRQLLPWAFVLDSASFSIPNFTLLKSCLSHDFLAREDSLLSPFLPVSPCWICLGHWSSEEHFFF